MPNVLSVLGLGRRHVRYSTIRCTSDGYCRIVEGTPLHPEIFSRGSEARIRKEAKKFDEQQE